jgi:hypothetical protein
MTRQYIYILNTRRWAGEEPHSYVAAVFDSVVAALKEGLEHAEYRANKYEP